MTFLQQMRSSLQKQYEGILPEKAIQGCLDFWEAVTGKIRADAIDEAVKVAELEGIRRVSLDMDHPLRIAEAIAKLREKQYDLGYNRGES